MKKSKKMSIAKRAAAKKKGCSKKQLIIDLLGKPENATPAEVQKGHRLAGALVPRRDQHAGREVRPGADGERHYLMAILDSSFCCDECPPLHDRL